MNIFKLFIYSNFVFLISCQGNANSLASDLPGRYQRDKFIGSKKLEALNAVDDSHNWTLQFNVDKSLRLMSADQELFSGKWRIIKDTNPCYVELASKSRLDTCKFDENIVYFEKPTSLFSNFFEHIIFVKLRE